MTCLARSTTVLSKTPAARSYSFVRSIGPGSREYDAVEVVELDVDLEDHRRLLHAAPVRGAIQRCANAPAARDVKKKHVDT
jgi:hypothetical protein